MQKFKRIAAIVLAATMVLGCSLTALADGTGSATGEGTQEGHVEKKATSVVLPTVPESGPTAFTYVMDPERLIAVTSGDKYGDTVEFPADSDTGVYFNNGPKGGEGDDKNNTVYKNSSKPQTVINKSSHAISLTVSVTVASAETDIPLVADIEGADAAALSLALTVGEEAPAAITKDAAATKTVDIAGNASNYKVAVTEDGNGYEYRVLTLDEYKEAADDDSATQDDFDATWQSVDFSVSGAVTEGFDITSTTTAPTLNVTWSWTDPTATPAVVDAAPSIAKTTYTKDELSGDSGLAIFEVNYGSGSLAGTEITKVWFSSDDGATFKAFSASNTPVIDNENKSFGINKTYFATMTAKRIIRAYFDDDDDKYVTITVEP